MFPSKPRETVAIFLLVSQQSKSYFNALFFTFRSFNANVFFFSFLEFLRHSFIIFFTSLSEFFLRHPLLILLTPHPNPTKMARSGPDINLSFHKSRCDPPTCCFYFPNTTLEENLRIKAAVLDPNRMLLSTYVCVLQPDGVRVPTPVGLTPSEVRMSAGSEVRAVIRLQAAFPGFPATVQWTLVCV